MKKCPHYRTREASCIGKIGYPSGQSAGFARDRMGRKPGHKSRSKTNIYHCDYCSLWHLGR